MAETKADAERKALPVAPWLRGYKKKWLPIDLVAGLTVTALLVPEGMAYAQLAGLPPETAFYAAPVALVAYALLGSSRQLVVAVSATVAVISGSVVGEIADVGSEEFIALSAALAIVAGAISLLAGLFKLGRLAEFFSESVLTGFVFGLALMIAIKQVPKIFRLEPEEGNFFERTWDIVVNLGDAHGTSVVIGLGALAVMLGLERWFERIPAALVVLVGGILVGEIFDVADRGVEVVGKLPSGLAAPAIPDVAASDVTLLIVGGLGIAIVGFAEAIGPAQQFASEHDYEIDANRELIGIGAANVAAGAFQGFSIGSSLSKSAANDRAGAKTPMSLLVAAGLTALIALFLTRLFTNLPEPVLGAIVIVAVLGMMNVAKMRMYRRVRKADFWLAMTALVGVLLFDALIGLVVAVMVSLAAVVWRAATPQVSTMGRAPGSPALVSVENQPDAEQIDGLLLVRVDENMFFANAGGVREHVMTRFRGADPPVETVLLDLETTTWPDIPACDELLELNKALGKAGAVLALARVHADARALFELAGVADAVGEDNFYERDIEAIVDHLSRSGREIDDDRAAEVAATALKAIASHLGDESPNAARFTQAIDALETPIPPDD
jgi:SulP family sulfate permease